ncbi:MerR family transcriptional regulator [Paenibacillus sp. 22594]|uniref:MerR family transcriptional regulator n=1 Tax=Paenibacillus sp. 22594 TaxID=3453947 RepID=UPI003F82E2F9
MTGSFTMKEILEQCQISEDALRYYEKIGLLPEVQRKENGHRIYSASDRESIIMIKCLKKTGMSLQELKPILLLQKEGQAGANTEWVDQLRSYQRKIEQQQQNLQQMWEMIDMKLQRGEKFGQPDNIEHVYSRVSEK